MTGRVRVFQGPTGPVAISGIFLLCLALVLLAIGGVAFATAPEVFDMWMLAIGAGVLGGGVVWLSGMVAGPTSAARARMAAGRGSLAESAALSGRGAPPGLVRNASLPGAHGAPRPRPTPASPSPMVTGTSIAAQFAEANREVQALHAGEGAPAGWTDPAIGSRPSVAPSPEGIPGGPSPTDAEIDRLRARVRELEARVGVPPTVTALLTSPPPTASGWSGPARCVDCQTLLLGAPGERRCSRCGRPMCADCATRDTASPALPRCPDCRTVGASASAAPADLAHVGPLTG